MGLKHKIRTWLWKLGYDVTRFEAASHPIARRKNFLRAFGIDTVLDVGANTGQFALTLRNDLGYAHTILSFEPLSSAFDQLQSRAAADRRWQAFHHGLGDREETREIKDRKSVV